MFSRYRKIVNFLNEIFDCRRALSSGGLLCTMGAANLEVPRSPPLSPRILVDFQNTSILQGGGGHKHKFFWGDSAQNKPEHHKHRLTCTNATICSRDVLTSLSASCIRFTPTGSCFLRSNSFASSLFKSAASR